MQDSPFAVSRILAAAAGLFLVAVVFLAGVGDAPDKQKSANAKTYEEKQGDGKEVNPLAALAIKQAGGKDWEALITAAKGGHSSVVRALLAAGVDVNKTDDDGNAALQAAVHGGHSEIINALLAAGAGVNQLDGEGRTVLYIANLRLKGARDKETRAVYEKIVADLQAAGGYAKGRGKYAGRPRQHQRGKSPVFTKRNSPNWTQQQREAANDCIRDPNC